MEQVCHCEAGHGRSVAIQMNNLDGHALLAMTIKEMDMSDKVAHQSHETHIVEYRTHILVWICLLILTCFTVVVSGVQFHHYGVVVAMAVAAVKGSLVLAFFMHMKYESRIFQLMFGVVMVTLAIFIGLTFFDVLFR